MASSLSPTSNTKIYEITAKKHTKANGIEETFAKLSREENALLEEVNLQEWRKNLKLVRERSKS